MSRQIVQGTPSCSNLAVVMNYERGSVENARGQNVVEFALVLPLLLLLLLGVINIGLLINSQIILTHAAWEGARTGATLDISQGEGDAVIETAVLKGVSGLVDPDHVQIEISPDEDARRVLPWPRPRGQSLSVHLNYSIVLALPVRVELILTASAVSRIEYSNPP